MTNPQAPHEGLSEIIGSLRSEVIGVQKAINEVRLQQDQTRLDVAKIQGEVASVQSTVTELRRDFSSMHGSFGDLKARIELLIEGVIVPNRGGDSSDSNTNSISINVRDSSPAPTKDEKDSSGSAFKHIPWVWIAFIVAAVLLVVFFVDRGFILKAISTILSPAA